MNTQLSVGNPRFFASTGPHAIAAVAAAAGCAVTDDLLMLTGLASLEAARPDQISFIGHARHLGDLAETQAGAVLVSADLRDRVPAGSVPLVTSDPAASWVLVAALFHPAPCVKAGIHPSAVIAEDARIDATAEIGPRAVIGAGVEIGARCKIGSGAVIEDGVLMGPDCRIGANVSISHATLGARIYVYSGARIGQEGFGFSITKTGFASIPQLGIVVLGDDVEVGANTTIDRGALRDTVIGAGTRLDNLVQIAHGVQIGRNCAIAAQVGISGSADIGDFVVMGGQAGIADGMKVGSKARIGAQSGVMSTIDVGATVVSSPARPFHQVFREIALLKKLARTPGAATKRNGA